MVRLVPKIPPAADQLQTMKEHKKKKQKFDRKSGKSNFMKIGILPSTKKAQVHRVLPYWLLHPHTIGPHLAKDGCPTHALPFLNESLLKKLKNKKINDFFPVQKMVIPYLISQASCFYSQTRANDVCVSAGTGSGKTLAYVLPVLHNIAHLAKLDTKIRVLAILPTEQLALQVVRVFRSYGSAVGVRVGAAIGQTSFSQEQSELVSPLQPWQRALLPSGVRGLLGGTHTQGPPTHAPLVHVVVATPDRLKDHITLTPQFDLGHLRYLIFDEADRLVSGDGGQWMNSIVSSVTEQLLAAAGRNAAEEDPLAVLPGFGGSLKPVQHAQKLLLSATLSCDPEKLDALNLHDPVLFTTPAADPRLSHDGTASASVKSDDPTSKVSAGFERPLTLNEQFLVVAQPVQPLLLHHLLSTQTWTKTLVFTHTKAAAHKLAMLLHILARSEYVVAEFSSLLGKKQTKVANSFRQGRINVLVCTDSLSRGMDFADVDAVVNYDSTHCYETYVHRVGRTARAGKQGLAITMLREREHVASFKTMLSHGSSAAEIEELPVDITALHPLEQSYKDALETLKKDFEGKKHMNRSHRKISLVASRPLPGGTPKETAEADPPISEV